MPRISETRESLSSTYARIGALDVRNYGAVGDGVTDDRAAIQAAIDAAALIGAPVYVPTSPDPWVVGRSAFNAWALFITAGCAGIIGDGIGSTTIKLADATADGVAVIRGDSLTGLELSRFSVDGNNSRATCSVENENEGINLKSCSFVNLHDVEVYECGQDGIDCDDLTDSVISGCVLRDNWGVGIHVAGVTLGERVTISQCLTTGNGQERAAGGDPFGSGISVSGTMFTVTGCISKGDQRGIEVYNCTRSAVIGCAVKSAGTATTADVGIKVVDSVSVTISGCVVHGWDSNAQTGDVGILIYNASSKINVSGCVTHNNYYGVQINSTGNTGGDHIVSGTIANNSKYAGFVVTGVHTGTWTIANCQAIVAWYGYFILGSDGTISGCASRNTTEQGIDLRGSDNTVMSCRVVSSTKYGVRVYNAAATGNKIMGNDLTATLGAILDSGTGTLAHSNIENGVWVV